ncbi:MAG: hypothetical protein Kow0029_03760 [Candidatus Rifleibacteriota bacterium]
MGWLYEKLNDLFVEDDGTFPEICICNLTPEEVQKTYLRIRSICTYVVGKPTFFNISEEREMALDEVENAAQLVCSGEAQPFHFMVRDLKFEKDYHIPEIGIFILANAVALDYEKGRIWGEIEIESILSLILKISNESTQATIRLEESVSQAAKERFYEALELLKKEKAGLEI